MHTRGAMTHERPKELGSLMIDGHMVKFIIGIIVALGGMGGIIAGGATWKANIDNHLERIEEHLKYEDTRLDEQKKQIRKENNELQWLIQHSKDAKDAPNFSLDDSQDIDPFAAAARTQQITGLPTGVEP